MTTITELTSEAKNLIQPYLTKWKNAAFSTQPINYEKVKIAVQTLYSEMGIRPPKEFIRYQSPAQVWQDFSIWQSKTGSCLVCFWPDQLPRNINECWTYSTPLPDVKGPLLTKEVHTIVREAFDNIIRRDWYYYIVDYTLERYSTEWEDIEERGDNEDPTCQLAIDDFVFLAPFDWLVQEVACVDYCKTVLGCQCNDILYQAVEDLIQYGSIIMTFEHLCIICDRPTVFGQQKSQFISYQDGYRISNSLFGKPK